MPAKVSLRPLVVIVALLVALPAGAVTIPVIRVRAPDNPPDSRSGNCVSANCGSVGYTYFIAKHEVSNSQYAEFLNSTARSDPFGLYNTSMGSDGTYGGITRSGEDGSYSYEAKQDFEDKPVVYVSFYDALRFANWLNNGTPDTESGAYTITGPGIADNSITRNTGAGVFLPSENEWYKAAYYRFGGVYFDYPTGANTRPICVPPVFDNGNAANCSPVDVLTDVGAYVFSASWLGTFDQGGNAFEWNEQVVDFGNRSVRGGGSDGLDSLLHAVNWGSYDPTSEFYNLGFRIAGNPGGPLPESGAALLGLVALSSLLGLTASRRHRNPSTRGFVCPRYSAEPRR